jgi:hypothetical protein
MQYLYKIIANVIVVRIKLILSKVRYFEQFGFLKGRFIHEAIDMTKEGVHSIRLARYSATIIKIYLSKASDRVLWLYLRLLLLQVGFVLSLVKCIMGCVTSFF